MSRPSWDEYFLKLAASAATRGTCDRKQVGVILVRDKRVLATGYNGSQPGLPHCDDVGHLMIDGGCQRTTHAEANAVAQAARYGTYLEGCTCYSTLSPCLSCYKLLVSAGIARIVCSETYRVSIPEELLTIPICVTE